MHSDARPIDTLEQDDRVPAWVRARPKQLERAPAGDGKALGQDVEARTNEVAVVRESSRSSDMLDTSPSRSFSASRRSKA